MINRGLWPIVMFLLLIASWAYAGTIKVNSLEDANARDDAITLREAILLSEGSLIFNVLVAAEQDQVSPPVGRGIADTINFSISGTMMPTSGLPNITDDGTVIDASSQWSGVWPEGQPGVILDGTNAGNVAGLIIGGSANCHIRNYSSPISPQACLLVEDSSTQLVVQIQGIATSSQGTTASVYSLVAWERPTTL